MNPNPVLHKLGFADDDRVVIVHADDVGMCQATLPAFAELVEFGLVTSGSTMVPCSWFPAAAAFAREHPELDLGVHSTLTCEWDAYRWGPISTRDPKSGLMDDEGYFHRTSEGTQEHGQPEAAQAELAAQLDRALIAGVDVTHFDTHMGTVAHPKFMMGYVKLAIEHGVPPMVPRLDEEAWKLHGADEQSVAFATQLVRQLEEQGLPLLDYLIGLPLDQPGDHVALAKRIFDSLPAGLTHLIIHPAVDTPELRAIAPDWECRVANYKAFMSTELRDYVFRSGIKLIGYRALRDLMRAQQ